MSDRELLRRFQETGSEGAFRALVERYAGLVFAVARRRTGNRAVAEEVVQTVFVILAAKAGRLKSGGELAPWLHRTALLEASNAARKESARQRKLHEYVEMTQDVMTQDVPHPDWTRISPVLDEAIDRLRDGDRSAVMMRYYEGLSFRDVAQVLGKSEAAARQQVSRALSKLAGNLRRRGITTTASALGVGMTTHLSAAVAGGAEAAISHAAICGAGGLSKTQLFLNQIYTMAYAKTKTALAVAVVAAIPIGLQWNENRRLKRELNGGPGVAENVVPSKSDRGRATVRRGIAGSGHLVRGGERARGLDRSSRTAGAPDWRDALYEQDPVRRAQRIAELIADLDPRTASEIAELFFGAEAEQGFESEARLFVRAWAQLAGPEAVEFLRAKGEAGSASSAMLAALGGWASSAPQAARQWAEAVEDEKLREDLLFGVIDGWALVDFQAAADYAETRPQSEARTRFIDLLFRRSMATGDLTGAQSWFAGISDNEHNEIYKRRAFERIVDAMLYRDPSAAAQWIASQAGEAFVSREAIDMTAMKLAATAPESALQWLSSMPALDEGVSAGTQGRVMGQWAGNDPEAAGQWLGERLDAPGFDAMARSYSGAVVQFDGPAALDWARVIEDSDQREAAVIEIARQRLRGGGEEAVAALRAEGLSEEQLRQAQERSSFENLVVRSYNAEFSNRILLDSTGGPAGPVQIDYFLNDPSMSASMQMSDFVTASRELNELQAHVNATAVARNELAAKYAIEQRQLEVEGIEEMRLYLDSAGAGSGTYQALPAGHMAVHGQSCAACHRGN